MESSTNTLNKICPEIERNIKKDRKVCNKVFYSNLNSETKEAVDKYFWLDVENENTLKCAVCSKYHLSIIGKNNFGRAKVLIKTNYKSNFFLDHSNTDFHQYSLKKLNEQFLSNPPDLIKQFKKIKIAEIDLWRPHFAWALFVALKNRPFGDYEKLMHGSKMCKTLSFYPKYKSYKAAQQIMKIIARFEREKLMKKIQSCDFLGISIDESTDICMKKELVIVIKGCDKKGKVFEQFFDLIEIKELNSEYISKKLIEYLEENKILTKIVAITTDGAPTMLSSQNGVAGFLRSILPDVIITHCISHRLNLCYKDIFINPQFDLHIFHDTILEVVSYFKSSYINIVILEEEQKKIFKKSWKLKTHHNIRWLSSYKVISRILKLYTAIQSCLQDENSMLLEKIDDLTFLWRLCYLADLLNIVEETNNIFQKRNLSLKLMLNKLESNKDWLKKIVDLDDFEMEKIGDNTKKFYDALKNKEFDKLFNCTKEMNKKSSNFNIKQAVKEIKLVSNALLGNLINYFPDYDAIRLLKIMDFREIFKLKIDELHEYGNEDLRILYDSYLSMNIEDLMIPQKSGKTVLNNGYKFDNNIYREKIIGLRRSLAGGPLSRFFKFIPFKEILDEWILFKSEYGSSKNYDEANCFFQLMNKNDYKYIKALFCLKECWPLSSVECERSFFQMSLIKTKIRNQLNHKNLNLLLQLKTCGICMEDYNIDEAIEYFGESNKKIFSG